jgi:predicted GIY-YIG superfamily endonuclease
MTSGIYVIQCNNKDKYYVGKSKNIEKRINQHKNGNGAKFVKDNGGVYNNQIYIVLYH